MSLSDIDEIERLKKDGHTNRCACKMVWDDGQCICGKQQRGVKPTPVLPHEMDRMARSDRK